MAIAMAPRGAAQGPGNVPAPAPGDGGGLLRFVGNAELKARQEAEKEAEKRQSAPVITNLGSYIRTQWIAAREEKRTVELQMLKNLRQREGQYEPSDLTRIKTQGGSEVFINITQVKCRAAEAWIADAMLPAGERPWSAKPTPIPDLPDDVTEQIGLKVVEQFNQAIMLNMELGELSEQQILDQIEMVKADVAAEVKDRAEKAAEELETEIDDELTEGGYYEAIRAVIRDIVTMPAGIIHGPYMMKEKKLEWQDAPNGLRVATVVDKLVRRYRRCNPFDIYPLAGAKSLQDGLCELITLSRAQLTKLIGVDGFDEGAIRLVLRDYGNGGLREWAINDSERRQLEQKTTQSNLNNLQTIDCIKYVGSCQGILLLSWGMDPEMIEDPLSEYPVEAYLIGHYVIGARLNRHPLGQINYFSASYEQSHDSVWGQGVPELMDDIQRICNGAARAVVNNMAHASGPMMWHYANRVANGEVINSVIPWKVLRMITKPGDTSTVPAGYFQPTSIVDQLLKVFQYFYDQASECTGIPAYIYGSDQIGGAGKTASGLSMLMNAAAKGLKNVISHIDKGIIVPSIKEHWLQIMVYEPEKAKGDVDIVARASEYLVQAEQLQLRRQEFLDRTNNPTDMQIMGIDGRAEILRETARALKMPVDRIIPNRDDMIQNMDQAMIQAVIQRISQAFGAPVELIAQIANGQQQGGPVQSGGELPGGMAPQQGRVAA